MIQLQIYCDYDQLSNIDGKPEYSEEAIEKWMETSRASNDKKALIIEMFKVCKAKSAAITEE